MFLAAFPDAHITDEDVIAEGHKVVRRYTTRGTHQGETQMFGPPTGRQIEQKGITIHRIEDGKIVEEWESLLPSSRSRPKESATYGAGA